jgi:hypothetical protein
MKIRDIKFDPARLIEQVREGAAEGADKTAAGAAEEARQTLMDPPGRGARGLSNIGYQGEGVVIPGQYPHDASGALVKSIRTERQGDTSVALTDSPYASELNYGRQPGMEPAVAELEEWAKAKSLSVDLRTLAKRIAANGMAATGFWTVAENFAEMNARDNMAEAIGKRLKK